jgi:DNA-directed RNA polymerase subunit beta
MNIGQILEVHLGWAKGLGEKINRMLKISVSVQVAEMRRASSTRSITDLGEKEEVASTFSDDESSSLRVTCVRGVPFATPVFDGAKESRNQDHAEAGRSA